jgi:hypothetical protein
MAKNLISLGSIQKGEWIIQPSLYKGRVLVMMYNYVNGRFYLQYLNDNYEANIFIEYVLEKGEL